MLKPHSVALSTARKLTRFVTNPHNKARITVGNRHRRPFYCRGPTRNLLKSQPGLRNIRRKQFYDRSKNFRYDVVITTPWLREIGLVNARYSAVLR
jgi:hypothetical protein